MSNYKPLPTPKTKLIGNPLYSDIAGLYAEFDPFEPDSKYSFVGRIMPNPITWKVIKPQAAEPIGDLPALIKNLIKSTWKFTEPSWDNMKGSLPGHVAHGVTIGTRGGAAPKAGGAGLYNPQVRPTASVIQTTFPTDTAIASDWKVFNWIRRTNAVTFRGDSRSPVDVISKADGFHPPNSRTDRYYLENNIFNEFANYLKRRHNRDLTKEKFLGAVDKTAVTMEHKNLLVDYMMWRKITEKEAVHMGRMVENECLKGYISTAKSIDTSLYFASAYGTRPGWLYLTLVHGGFMVPNGDQHYWGSQEAEIAQWGPIPGKRIVGFVHVNAGRVPDGPIFIRRSFRTGEPAVFEHMFKVMSGMVPI